MTYRGLGHFGIWLSVFATNAFAASIGVYIAQPGRQTSPVNGTTTATFDTIATGNKTVDITTPIGTYDTSPTNILRVNAADQYGGADNSRYVTFGAQTGTAGAISLTLLGPRAYFGFWWSAGDGNNGLSFYDGSKLLMRFQTSDITKMLSPTSGTVTALNGNTYNNADYYGNPNDNNPRRNSGEPYAYVMFFFRDVTIDRIVFDNSGATGSGFESDNHSVRASLPNPNNRSVLVGNYAPVQDPVVSNPEPGTMATMAGALLMVGMMLRRRSRAAGGSARDQRRGLRAI